MKRKLLTMLTALALCLSLLPAGALADGATLAYFDGQGTAADPYRIFSDTDLTALADIVNGGEDCEGMYFELMKDAGPVTTSIGDNTHPFQGTFDGGNHTVTLDIIRPEQSYIGLFGYLGSGGTVRNVTTTGTVNGYENVGGVCGYLNGGTIEYCCNKSTVLCRIDGSGAPFVGGVCGYNSGKLLGCVNAGEVLADRVSSLGGVCGYNSGGLLDGCRNTGTVSGGEQTGGVCGINEREGRIINCLNSAEIKDSYHIGGVCSQNLSGTIGNCYNTTDANGTYSGGGICATNGSGGQIVNCYSGGSVTGENGNGGICGSNYGSLSHCYYDSSVYPGAAVGSDSGSVDGDTVTGLTAQQCRAFSGDDALVTRLNSYTIDESGNPAGDPWVVFSGTPQLANPEAFWEAMGTTVYRDGNTGVTFTAETDKATGEKVFVRRAPGGGTVVLPVRAFLDSGYYAPESLYFFINGEECVLDFTVQNGRITKISYLVDGEETGDSFLPEKKSGGTTTYAVSVLPAENGTVTADRKTAAKGRTVTLTVTPAEGYASAAPAVTDRKGKAIDLADRGDGTYTFSMPASKVTVTGAFEKIPCPMDSTCPIDTLTDTANDKWWHDGIHFCVEKGLMVGMTTRTETGPQPVFKPDHSLSRAQIVTILWRLEGQPVVNYLMRFADADGGQWYTEAIRWAQSTGLVTGYRDTAFGTNDPVTREQLAVILYRYAQSAGVDTDKATEDTNTLSFDDVFSVSDWAVSGVHYCVAAGVLTGSDNKLNPQGEATRAQAAAMLQRFCENVKQ